MSAHATNAVQVLAPAKLNLFLELHERREDGFHELETVMVAINRYDHLCVARASHKEVHLACRWLPNHAAHAHQCNADNVALPPTEQNLVWRALQLFRERFDIAHGFDCQLDKSIPAGAGMGGASSDAAAALQAAAKLCGMDPHASELIEIAGALGSDIPFFFGQRDAPAVAALATGRGERITPIAVGGPLNFIVVHPPQGISTAEAYRDCKVPKQPIDSSGVLDSLALGDAGAIASQLTNRLVEPARRLCGHVSQVLDQLSRMPLLGYQMTGSGSACFGLCSTAALSRRVAHQLNASGVGLAFAARGINLNYNVTSSNER